MACSALPSMPPSPRYHPAPLHRTLGEAFFDAVEPARFPEHLLRYRNERWAERVGLGDARRRRVGGPLRALRAAAREPDAAARAALPRPPVPRVQPRARRRPRLPLRAAARRRGRPAPRPRHQGQRQDAVVARRRRPAHAQGRRARGAGDGDAGGARRADVEVVQPVRDRRARSSAATSRRPRARRCWCACPLAHPLRHLPAPALPRRVADRCARLVDFSSSTTCPRRPAAAIRSCLPARRHGAQRAAVRRLDGGRLRPRRAQHRQHERSPGRASTTARTASCRPSIPDFVAAYFDHGRASTPSAASPRRALESGAARRRARPAGLRVGPRARARRIRASVRRGVPRGRCSTRLGVVADRPRRGRGARRRDARVPRREPYRRRSLLLRLVRRTGQPDPRAGAAPQPPLYAGPAVRRVPAAARGVCAAPSRRLALPYWQRAAPCTLLIDDIETLWAAIAERDDWGPFAAKLDEIETLRLAGEPLVRVSESSR